MTAHLTAPDLEHAARAIRLLLAPLDAPSVDAWRSEVNRVLGELLHADSAGFILPGMGGPVVYSDEHDPEALARYPEILPPLLPDGRTVFAKCIERGPSTLEELWEELLPAYLNSAYHNDYAAANGAHDALSGLVSLGGTDPLSMAGLQFWHGSPRGRRFGARESALFRLVFPALRVGIETQLRWGHHRTELLDTLDRLGQATLVCDPLGRPLHRTPALLEALDADPEAEALQHAMLEVAAGVCRLSGAPPPSAVAAPPPAAMEVRTARAAYRVSGCAYRSPFSHWPALVLVALERTSPALRPEWELREAFGLTPAELRVAAHLVSSRSSAEIARELNVSTHTVRRHTERILFKTGTRSRAELALKILR